MDRLRLCLYQPDIPQNAGTLLRLSACLGVPVDMVEPCGFVMDAAKLRRAGMDYLDHARLCRHVSWAAFQEVLAAQGRRLLLLTTKGETRYDCFSFRPGDTIMVGRESAGVPDMVAAACAARLVIPMAPGARSLNVALAAAMAVGEALRQTGGFPEQEGEGA